MKYRVTAKFIQASLADFYRQLTDGSIESQIPDGGEIVASMKRARMTEPGLVEWFETCYCQTPLKHERETVYDRFFSEISTNEVSEYRELNCGVSFWSYLEGVAAHDRLSKESR